MPSLKKLDEDRFCDALIKEMDEESFSYEDLVVGLSKAIARKHALELKEEYEDEEDDYQAQDMEFLRDTKSKYISMSASMLDSEGLDHIGGPQDLPVKLWLHMSRPEAVDIVRRIKEALDYHDDIVDIHVGLRSSFEASFPTAASDDGSKYHEGYCIYDELKELLEKSDYYNHKCCCACCSARCPETRDEKTHKERKFSSVHKLYGLDDNDGDCEEE